VNSFAEPRLREKAAIFETQGLEVDMPPALARRFGE
jgi:hypothetical protein